MGMPSASIAQNPTNSPRPQSGGKGTNSMETFPVSQVDQGYRSSLQSPQFGNGKGGYMQPSNMTISSTSGQPTTGQPNVYANTTGSWDNSSNQQPSYQMNGKGKGA